MPGFPPLAHPLRGAEAVRLPVLATTNVSWVTCSPDAAALGALCGDVPVLFDRNDPSQGTINIYFELYAHSAPGPAESAILGNFGGPGWTTSGRRGNFLYIFGPNLDVHDLLLVDDRGRGLSDTIACPELQYGLTTFTQATADCAAQLGNSVSWYGTGDVSEDTDAVRAALGYDKVDYYGGSYGGADATAYATRFGEHLRSIVLDAPFGTPAADAARFVWERYRAQSEPLMVRRDCQRSPTCSPDHPFPEAELNALIWTVRLNPVEGDAYDANGNLVQVRMDEASLLNFVVDNATGFFTSTGEVLAAAQSLWQGDARPLLRLGAEGYWTYDYMYVGDPTVFSFGALEATTCADWSVPFDWSAPVQERLTQYAATVSDLPPWYFAPFSNAAATGQFSGTRRCVYWQKPGPSSPIAPPRADYPYTPTLVLTGDLDNTVPFAEVTKVANLFPNSTLVSVAEAGHETVLWTQCAVNLASQFVENEHVGDTSCAKTPETVWAAVGRFPLLAQFARPAAVDPSGQNQIGLGERKVVTVAVATATDALQRSILGSGSGVGLRAGAFSTDYGDGSVWTTTLTNCAFATDVTVNGTVTWSVYGALTADLTVGGSGTAGGSLHVEGAWQAPGPVGNFKVTGTLGGKQVAVLVPEA